MSQTPAGWYADPNDAQQIRYWDGSAWTEHVAPAPVAPPTSPPVTPTGSGVGTGAKVAISVGATVVVAAAVGITLLLSGGGDEPAPTAAPREVEQPGGSAPTDSTVDPEVPGAFDELVEQVFSQEELAQDSAAKSDLHTVRIDVATWAVETTSLPPSMVISDGYYYFGNIRQSPAAPDMELVNYWFDDNDTEFCIAIRPLNGTGATFQMDQNGDITEGTC